MYQNILNQVLKRGDHETSYVPSAEISWCPNVVIHKCFWLLRLPPKVLSCPNIDISTQWTVNFIKISAEILNLSDRHMTKSANVTVFPNNRISCHGLCLQILTVSTGDLPGPWYPSFCGANRWLLCSSLKFYFFNRKILFVTHQPSTHTRTCFCFLSLAMSDELWTSDTRFVAILIGSLYQAIIFENQFNEEQNQSE